MNVNDVGGCGAGGGHRGQIYRNAPENAPHGSASVSTKMISLSLCPWKSDIGPIGGALSDPICEIGLNGDDGWKSDEVSTSCSSDCYRMTLYA